MSASMWNGRTSWRFFYLQLDKVKLSHNWHGIEQATATYGTRAKRGTIFNGTLSELKYSNYDLIKNESLIK